jgi:sugar/nucleoside kinase (ribokinase family)
MPPDAIGIGFAAVDLLLGTEDLPKEDGFSFVHEERLLPGGSCANAMVTVARMGGSAGLIAKMGDDHYGKMFIGDLEQAGVSSTFVSVKPGGTSLHNVIAVSGNGAKAMFSYVGNSLFALSEDEVSAAMLHDAKVLYNEMVPAKPALKLARSCKASGIPIVCNLQVGLGFMALCGVPRTEIDEMLKICDLFISNQHLMIELADGNDCTEAVSAIYEIYRPSIGIIATMGEKGSLFLDNEKSLVVPSLDIQAVDTTGAGDAFSGGLIYARFIKGLSMKESLAFATGCAAFKCTQPGPRLNADEADILRFIEEFR